MLRRIKLLELPCIAGNLVSWSKSQITSSCQAVTRREASNLIWWSARGYIVHVQSVIRLFGPKIINLLYILVLLKCLITNLFFLKPIVRYLHIQQSYLKKKILKRLKQSDNIHCVLRHKLQTVVIRILKKKSHCADRKSHTTLLQFTVSRNEING